MKFICDKKDLAAALKIATRALSNKNSMVNPILDCVLVKTNGDDEIELVCNDLELAISTTAPADIIEHGCVALDGKLFTNIINGLSNGDVSIDCDEGNLNTVIKSGKAKFNIPGKPAEDFVGLPKEKTGVHFEVPVYEFCRAIAGTNFCTTQDSSMRMMEGECITFAGDTMTVTALDGHRIGLRRIYLDSNEGQNAKVIIPVKSLNEVAKIADGDTMDVSVEEGNVIFRFGSTIVNTRVIDGEYFDVDKIAKADTPIKVTANRKDLLNAIGRSTAIVEDKLKKPLVVTVDDKELRLDAVTALGSTSDAVDIEKTGDDIRIGYNPRFLMDALKAIDDEVVTLGMLNRKSPTIIEDEEKTYLYVVLPVNINN